MSPSMYRHITTPIFYPNASPHLGHLYSSLLADVQHRWNQLQMCNSKFTTGTDEHGLKIQHAAIKNGYTDPLKFVDTLVPKFKYLDTQYGINYTTFIRTTDVNHIENVKKLWEICYRNGHIYKDVHHGWYSISDETFYPESKITKLENEDGTSVKYINTETNNEVTYHKETNYFFKLSGFQDHLIELHSRGGSNAWIFPESKRLALLNELKSRDLSDLSISRPSERLSWAIPVPNDSTQSIYVWFDALTNYISSLGPLENLYSKNSSNEMKKYWLQTTHIIGKDIMKFHCWYWPSFLLSAGLPLPKQVIIHDHWLSQGVKMSKSLGNVIDPMKLPSKYGKDIVRWSILENSQLDHDNNFKYEDLSKCRNMFISKWGNLINRCCNAKSKFNLSRAVTKTCVYVSNKTDFINMWGQQSSLSPVENDQVRTIFEQLESLQETFAMKMETFQYNLIIKDIWHLIDQLNLFIQTTKPWNKTFTNQTRQDLIIFLTMDISRILSILTKPIIPNISNRFLDRIDVSLERRSISDAKFGVDHTYGVNANDPSMEVPIERKVASYEY